jgi:hypothetical protein
MGDVISIEPRRAARARTSPPQSGAANRFDDDEARGAPQLVLFPGLRIDLIRIVLASWQAAKST